MIVQNLCIKKENQRINVQSTQKLVKLNQVSIKSWNSKIFNFADGTEHLLIDVTDIYFYRKKKYIYILCHDSKKLCKFFKLLS